MENISSYYSRENNYEDKQNKKKKESVAIIDQLQNKMKITGPGMTPE